MSSGSYITTEKKNSLCVIYGALKPTKNLDSHTIILNGLPIPKLEIQIPLSVNGDPLYTTKSPLVLVKANGDLDIYLGKQGETQYIYGSYFYKE